MVPFGMAVVALVDFWICSRGGRLIDADAVHGGVVLFGKHTPFDEGVALAAFVTVPGGAPATRAVIVKRTCPPAGNVAIVWLTAPAPEARGQTAPPLALQVQLLKLAMPAG